jgi:predicted CoA-substrate-specific enzyme activase
MHRRLNLGIDVGSTTVKVVALAPDGRLLGDTYVRSCGRPRPTLLAAVRDVVARAGGGTVATVGITGSGGGPIARLVGGRHVNELIAQTRAVAEYHPEARTVIEIGGQDSKLLTLEQDPGTGELRLLDFSMNALCAAGTGSFLDQQGERLGLDIELEFAALALRSSTPARIAGRCTVFAKSDMIHLQQAGTPLPDILAGLCLALARNFKAVIGRGKPFTPPVVFQGGVAANAAVVRAFEEVLGQPAGSLLIPRHHRIMAALGAALIARDEPAGEHSAFRGFEPLEEAVRGGPAEPERLPPLRLDLAPFAPGALHGNGGNGAARAGNGGNGARPASGGNGAGQARRADGRPVPAFLGIDVGSISTCLALVDGEDRLLARRYLLTAGAPLEAVRQGLAELQAEVGDRVRVRGVGTTGSGRYLTADFVGADVVRNEITAQARAAVAADPGVDTVFEIGGQDSKYIRLHRGTVVDFNMNHACAAGTGSFLEEQAERLRVDVAGEFSHLAFTSPAPVSLGARCTVFMESDLVHHQQQGRSVEDLTAGLAYSIAANYLDRVVHGRHVGERILFQGGVAWNQAVVAAFQATLDRPVVVPPNHDVTGAIGVAILAREARPDTRFRGFSLADRQYRSETFECRACPNLCQVSRVTMSGDPPAFHGARCDRFEEAGRARGDASAGIPDLFAERAELLLGGHVDAAPGGRPRVGIPRALLAYDLFPYWRTFFEALDFGVVLSDATNPAIMRASGETAAVEACFPVKLMYGHVENLVAKGVDYLFLPSVINRERIAPGQTHAQYCPYIPAAAHLVAAHLELAARGVQLLQAPLEMSWVPERRTQLQALAPVLGVSRRRIVAAAAAARDAQQRVYAAYRQRADRLLRELTPEDRAVVIVGRPYNTHDRGATLDLPYKLRRLGVLPVPMDFLPLAEIDVSGRYPNSFWRSGQDILAAAELVRRDPRLTAIYLTNFSCGPDSFLIGFFRRLMGDRPFLELEVDDHTADAGLITRCEAFLESWRSA